MNRPCHRLPLPLPKNAASASDCCFPVGKYLCRTTWGVHGNICLERRLSSPPPRPIRVVSRTSRQFRIRQAPLCAPWVFHGSSTIDSDKGHRGVVQVAAGYQLATARSATNRDAPVALIPVLDNECWRGPSYAGSTEYAQAGIRPRRHRAGHPACFGIVLPNDLDKAIPRVLISLRDNLGRNRVGRRKRMLQLRAKRPNMPNEIA